MSEIFRWKLTLSTSFSKINFSKCSCQTPLSLFHTPLHLCCGQSQFSNFCLCTNYLWYSVNFNLICSALMVDIICTGNAAALQWSMKRSLCSVHTSLQHSCVTGVSITFCSGSTRRTACPFKINVVPQCHIRWWCSSWITSTHRDPNAFKYERVLYCSSTIAER